MTGARILEAKDFVSMGLTEPGRLREIRRVAEQFAVAVTKDVAELIDPADPADPIAAQFVPTAAELTEAPEEWADPIGDERWSPVPGIVHRYPDRVLLKPTLLCPVYCRFCFRREQVGGEEALLSPEALAGAFDYIRARPEIWEVIVTGGDPFLLSPRRIAAIVKTLDAIPHVAVIRFHTRVPIADPRRVLARSAAPILSPTEIYECMGLFNDTVFSCGVVPLGENGERIRMYYGAADSVVAAADFDVREILDSLEPC